MFTDSDEKRLSEAIADLYGHQSGDASSLRSILHELLCELKWAHDEILQLEDRVMDLERRE